MDLTQRLPNPAASKLKRTTDVLVGSIALLLFAPLFVAVAIGVRMTSPGPIFYAQDRVGLQGRIFRFYKFRSMLVNSDWMLAEYLNSDDEARATWDRFQKSDCDPRITRFGRFIRRTSLDELPQLWNVLTGDMSMVGPRPCLPAQESLYREHWSEYCHVRPGLTGLWQISGRNRLTYDERVALDVKYVRTWSIWLDLAIFVKTLEVVLTGDGSK